MSAKLSRKEKAPTGWTFGVVLSDGGERVTTVNDLTDAVVESFARSESAKLDAIVPTGKTRYNVGDAIDLTPPAPAQQDPALTQFLSDRNTLLSLQRHADLRLIAPNDSALLAAYDAISKSYKPEFAEFV